MKDKIKNSIIGILLMSTIGIVGCADSFLDRISPNSVSDDIFWKTEKDVDLALTGCYQVLRRQTLYNCSHTGANGFFGLDMACDNGYMTWDYRPGAAIARGDYSTSDAKVFNIWSGSYAGIGRCNTFISNIEAMDETVLSAEKKKRVLAEARFLRALHYNNLTILFRDVPLVTNKAALQESNVPKNSHSEIIEFITSDLKSCVDDLPLPSELQAAEWGRATRGAAYALLGEIYLNDKQYAEAAEWCKKVMDLGYYELFPDYTKLFTVENEMCKEVIFSVCYQRGLGGQGSGFGWFKYPRVPDNHHVLKNLADDYYCIDGLPITQSPLYNKDLETENRDIRFGTTIISKGSLWQGKVVDDGQLVLTGYAQRKWVEENTENIRLDQHDSSQDFYIFRYAHILLNRAEALVEAGSFNEAEVLPLINAIRERVGMPKVESVEGTGLSKDKWMEIIRHERRVETAFEGRRYFDLRRWNLLKERTDFFNEYDRKFNPGLQKRTFDESKHNVWPIPQSELDKNPALEQHDEWK